MAVAARRFAVEGEGGLVGAAGGCDSKGCWEGSGRRGRNIDWIGGVRSREGSGRWGRNIDWIGGVRWREGGV